MDKPSVFISYNHNSSRFVEELVHRLDGFADVHWDKNVGPWGSFHEFMNSIRGQDYAVLIISDRYLKSHACLYEVVQLMSVADWDKKTLFIVEEDAHSLFDIDGRLSYVEYWDEKYNNFEEKLGKLSREAAASQLEEIETLRKIKTKIGEFLIKIADVNNPDVWKAIDEIVDRIKISGKKNSSSELEGEILFLVVRGYRTISDIAKATNRSQNTILSYVRKLKRERKLVQYRENGKKELFVAHDYTFLEDY